MASNKNAMLSPAATDLGLGDALKAQLEAQEIERKKRLAQQQAAARMGGTPLGAGTMSLYGQAGGFSI